MEIIHVLNRGVDKREIFLDEQDRFRFIHDLFEFNDVNSVNNIFYNFKHKYNNDVRRRKIGGERKPREMLVNILAFCLMPNHYHLVLMPKVDNGMALFMKKLNGGYAKYFNVKYERSGALFQGKYKRVVVKNEAHFIHLPYYIHLNPLDLIAPEWREKKINNLAKAIGFLNSYRWSSHLDYINEKNFPSITQRDFLLEFFGDHKQYKKDIERWLKDLSLENIHDLMLE